MFDRNVKRFIKLGIRFSKEVEGHRAFALRRTSSQFYLRCHPAWQREPRHSLGYELHCGILSILWKHSYRVTAPSLRYRTLGSHPRHSLGSPTFRHDNFFLIGFEKNSKLDSSGSSPRVTNGCHPNFCALRARLGTPVFLTHFC